MATTKKALLSKLKKGLAEKRRATTTTSAEQRLTVASLDELASTYQRRVRFLQEMRIMLGSDASTQDLINHIRKHLSYYPNDHGFHRLFSLLDDRYREQLLLFVQRHTAVEAEEEDIMQSLKSFVQRVVVEETVNQVEIITNLVRGLPTPIARQTLLDIDAYIFHSLQFMPTINDSILPGLVREVFGDGSTTPLARTPVDLRHTIDRYVYDHLYDGILHYLRDPTVSDDDKQAMTLRFLQDEYEGTQSQQLYLQLMDIVDRKVKPFQPVLQSLMYRFLPDKEKIAPLKRFMEVVLEITLSNASGPALQKYFPTRSAFEHFQTYVLPMLPDKVDRVIRARCREEFVQPFLYRHAYRVKWTDFVNIIQSYLSNRLIPMELRLYDSLQKHANERLEQIMTYLQDVPENAIDRRLLHTMLERFIHTQPYKQQLMLKKLLKQSVSTIRTALEDRASVSYLETLDNLASPSSLSMKVPLRDMAKIKYINLLEAQTKELYRLRPFVPGFDHVAIRPYGGKDNILKYMADPSQPMTSVSYARVSDVFFEHLADPKIPKSQQGTKFTMGGVNMIVANVTIHEEYIVQNEETWQHLLSFVNQQKKLQTILHPLHYFTEFTSTPMSLHRSQLVHTLREHVRASLHHTFQRSIGQDILTKEVSHAMESSIYGYANTMGQYVQNVARVMALVEMPSQYRTTFLSFVVQQRLNLAHFGELVMNLEVMMSVIAPELESVRPPSSSEDPEEGNRMVQQAFANEVDTHMRRILLDAYAIEFPTRRLPYLPSAWDRTLMGWRDLEVSLEDVDVLRATIPETWTDKYLLPALVADVVTQETIDRVEEVDAPMTMPATTSADPLSNFLDVALHTIDEL